MFETLGAIFHVSGFTQFIVALLAVWAGALVRMLGSSLTVMLVTMYVTAVGALASIYVLAEHGIYFTSYKPGNIVISSSIGMILSFLMLVGVLRIIYSIADWRRPVMPAGERQQA